MSDVEHGSQGEAAIRNVVESWAAAVRSRDFGGYFKTTLTTS